MSPRVFFLLLAAGFVAQGTRLNAALGETPIVAFAAEPGALTLANHGETAPLLVDSQDWPGVVRAAHDFQADIERVTKLKPKFLERASAGAREVVLIGTIGHSPLLDRLVADGKLDVAQVRGQWESWVTEVVANPLPGIERALVIAGSDKRGTIYGIYDLSQQIGVSPWYWWADVPATPHSSLYVKAGRVVHASPAVKYRGIFLNDEAPDLTNWIRAKFGNIPPSTQPPIPRGIANYNHEFYARIFEVLLRLRGNYLWPAMWDNAFNEDDPRNPSLADEYGIVMGTSHQEPMLRAQKEWDRRYHSTLGSWNYAKNPRELENFWREGVRRNKNFESVVTLGLRGANDTEMAPGGPAANRELLEGIVDVQRKILREEVNPDLRKVSQVWCLYKEVMEYYDAGMRVPDDVTLLWAEDNWGNLRRLPTPAERKREGGAGVYYHFDYHGSPRNYQWINTNPLPKVWEQLSLAAEYGADRVWIVNVGHFKGYEVPLEFFMSLAWAPQHWNRENVPDFLLAWAAREFGEKHAARIAEIVAKYAKFNGRRKPEMLSPETYSVVNYREWETVAADFDAIARDAETIYKEIPEAQRDAFYQLVLFPTKASALVNELYFAAAKNALYAQQGRASANAMAARTRALFAEDLALMAYYNHDYAGGRWAHFMDQTHLGYTTWRDPPENSLRNIKLTEVSAKGAPALGVAVEGSARAWPDAKTRAVLPGFDAFNRQESFLEVFNRGKGSFAFTAAASEPWIFLSETSGTVENDRRIKVSIDWTRVPTGKAHGSVQVSGANQSVAVDFEVFNPAKSEREGVDGFVENQGVISIEAEHFSKNTDAGTNHWARVADYGRTLSGMRAESALDAPPAVPGETSPSIEYKVHVFEPGAVEVTAIAGPTLNFIPNRAVRYAISFDDEPPQTVTLVPSGFKVQNTNEVWSKIVSDNANLAKSKHSLKTAGAHTLKIWMIDPAVVLEKLVLDLGGEKPTYLGPPESMIVGAMQTTPVR